LGELIARGAGFQVLWRDRVLFTMAFLCCLDVSGIGGRKGICWFCEAIEMRNIGGGFPCCV
jgi:hypothetical protein